MLRRHNILALALRQPFFAPDGAEGGAGAAVADAAAPATTGVGAGAETPAVAADADAGGSILGDAASPGDGVARAGDEGAAADADAASGDAADAEAAPQPYADLTAPEGFASIDTDALAAATPLMRQFGVPDDKAQEFINGAAPIISSMVERAVAANAEAGKLAQAELVKAWADEVRADPALGGANYDRTVASAAKVLDTFFDPEFREFLTITGLGNNPAMIRGVAKIASQIEEGSIHLGGATPKALEPHQKVYDPVYDGPQPTQ